MSVVQLHGGPLAVQYNQLVEQDDEEAALELLQTQASLPSILEDLDVAEFVLERFLAVEDFDDALALAMRIHDSLIAETCKVICYLKKRQYEKGFPLLKTLASNLEASVFVDGRISIYTDQGEEALGALFTFLQEKMKVVSGKLKSLSDSKEKS